MPQIFLKLAKTQTNVVVLIWSVVIYSECCYYFRFVLLRRVFAEIMPKANYYYAY